MSRDLVTWSVCIGSWITCNGALESYILLEDSALLFRTCKDEMQNLDCKIYKLSLMCACLCLRITKRARKTILTALKNLSETLELLPFIKLGELPKNFIRSNVSILWQRSLTHSPTISKCNLAPYACLNSFQ